MDELNKYYVYQLRLEDSDLPFYVGKGVGDRAYRHTCESQLKANTHKINIIKKAQRLGVSVLVEFLETTLSNDDAMLFEIYFISAYGRRINFGCLSNATDGGEGTTGHLHSSYSKAKMRISQTGKKQKPEHIAKRAASSVGKKMSKACCEKRSKARKGVPNKFFQGENNPKSKLTEGEIINCHVSYREGMSVRELIQIYPITTTNMHAMLKGRTWKELFNKFIRSE